MLGKTKLFLHPLARFTSFRSGLLGSLHKLLAPRLTKRRASPASPQPVLQTSSQHPLPPIAPRYEYIVSMTDTTLLDITMLPADGRFGSGPSKIREAQLEYLTQEGAQLRMQKFRII